jgi:hypothetical protein
VSAALEEAPGLARVHAPEVVRLVGSGPDSLAALAALDSLAFSLRRSRVRATVWPLLDEARTLLPARVRYFPAVSALPRTVEDLDREARAAGAGERAFTAIMVPWTAAPGTIVALERRGSVFSGKVERARVHVASGAPRTTRLDVLEAALVALEVARPSREDLERLVALVDSIETDEPRANSEAAVRFAVSCVERSRAIERAREVALAFLAAEGIEPIALAPGDRFDPETHSAQAFERKLVPGPKGRVVATELTGFKDRSGVILSRAVVQVGA